METLAIALSLAVINERIIQYFMAPVKRKYPDVDYWWLLYVALITGALIGWVSGLNLFDALLPSVEMGRVLTAIAIGGGSNLIHDLFDRSPGDGTRTTIESSKPSSTTVQVKDE